MHPLWLTVLQKHTGNLQLEKGPPSVFSGVTQKRIYKSKHSESK